MKFANQEVEVAIGGKIVVWKRLDDYMRTVDQSRLIPVAFAGQQARRFIMLDVLAVRPDWSVLPRAEWKAGVSHASSDPKTGIVLELRSNIEVKFDFDMDLLRPDREEIEKFVDSVKKHQEA